MPVFTSPFLAGQRRSAQRLVVAGERAAAELCHRRDAHRDGGGVGDPGRALPYAWTVG